MLKRRAEMKKDYQESYKKQVESLGVKGALNNQVKQALAILNNNPGETVNWNTSNTVVYTSRTHSQLAQAMKELKVTEYNHLNGVALGSRDQLCINEEVLKDATTAGEKVLLCRAKVKSKQCSYHTNVEKALQSPEVTNQTIMDIEDLVATGKSCKACPYYMSKQISGNADIVFLPYNYVLDPKLLKSFKLQLKDAIVILDEAHNIEKVCQDAASVQIASSDIATCMEDLTYIMKQLEDKGDQSEVMMGDDSKVDFTVEDCAKMKEMLIDLEKKIDSIDQVTSKGRTMPGGAIFDILNVAKITQETAPLILQLLQSQQEYLTQSTTGKVFARKGVGLSKVSDLVATVFGSVTNDVEMWKKTMLQGYRLFVELEEPKKTWSGNSSTTTWQSTSSIQTTINNKAKVLNYWCFNPGFGMANLVNRNVHSIILTSGTLAPIKPLISELALDVDFALENPHIINPTQILAKIIPQGPDGTVLNANFQNRDNPKFLQSIAMTIKSIAAYTPNGLLVFFPSYILMNKAKEVWEKTGMWKAIEDVKPIFSEPRRKTEFDECMESYYSAVKTSRGAIFMAVLRGKVSEGLDFKDENGRAVIIIGLPFAPYMDPRVILKKEYLEMNRNGINQLQSGGDWYNMEATRAVNQAIGRVIRHKDDYGAIFLCDTRFLEARNKSGLSRWVQSHIVQKSEKFKFQPIIKELREFFEKANATLPKTIPVKIKSEPVHLLDLDQVAAAKTKSQGIMKRQIKIENSNEIYGSVSSSRSTSIDYAELQKFVKQDQKPTSFFGGLSQDVKAIDFNVLEAHSSHFQQSSSKESLEEYESASKKRKLIVIPNDKQLSFVLTKEPVQVKREVFHRIMPKDRNDFLEIVSWLKDF